MLFILFFAFYAYKKHLSESRLFNVFMVFIFLFFLFFLFFLCFLCLWNYPNNLICYTTILLYIFSTLWINDFFFNKLKCYDQTREEEYGWNFNEARKIGFKVLLSTEWLILDSIVFA